MRSERDHILSCKNLIEKKLNLEGAQMMERDFEYLHEILLKETRTDISTSTLRRIWSGNYKAIPQIKTLDALAELVGFSCWHEFIGAQSGNRKKRSGKGLKILISSAVVMITLILLVPILGTDEAVEEVKLKPEIDKIDGVPATVGFQYEIKNPDTQIELSWNPLERAKLDPAGNYYSGTYFYPDLHRAKLLLDDNILIEKLVYVTTQGWHGLIMDSGYDVNPTLLKQSDFASDSGLFITPEVLIRLGIEISGKVFPVYTFSNEVLNQISGDDFRMNASVRSRSFTNNQGCRQYDILFVGTNGNIRIPISQIGCFGLTQLRCSDQILSGKTTNLVNLSTELAQDHKVGIINKDHILQINLASNPPFEIEYAKDIGELKVIKFLFFGSGELRTFSIENGKGEKLNAKQLWPFTDGPT